MIERRVINRTYKVTPSRKLEFQFTHDMVHRPSQVTPENEYILKYRQEAWDTFISAPMPTPKDEAWRRTDIKGMPMADFKMADCEDGCRDLPDDFMKLMLDDHPVGNVFLLPNGTNKFLEKKLEEKGVVFEDLRTAERDHPELLRKILGKVVRPAEGKFSAMAAALANTGVLLYIPQGVYLEGSLQSVLWGEGNNSAYFSHILVYLEPGASVTYIHEAASQNLHEEHMMHAGIVEINVSEGAHLRFVELQSWGEQVWNFSHERARIDRDGSIEWIFGAVGSKLTKNFSDLDLVGQGASGRISGFYFTENQQHLDHDTQQNHLAPNTTSDLLFKGALKGESRSVWQGMIHVAPCAQKTDGYQANRNLVLSPKARADSIPGLEILADDVRCTHGATVGKIDEDQRFYLLSRGIPRDEAERLIVEGFFEPIMQRIPFEGVRNRFIKTIIDKMG